MKIRIATEGRTITVDMEKEQAHRTFNNFASVLLGLNIRKDETQNESRNVQPCKEVRGGMRLAEAETNGQGDEYTGFLYIKCHKCGKIRGFCTKGITEYRCGCGHITPLHDLKPLYVNCQCGKNFKYMTNMDSNMFDVNCIECGGPVAVSWNAKKMIYQTIE